MPHPWLDGSLGVYAGWWHGGLAHCVEAEDKGTLCHRHRVYQILTQSEMFRFCSAVTLSAPWGIKYKKQKIIPLHS